MACNHDIAYLVRNACNANARVQSGAAPGHDRARAQHTPTCCRHEVVLVKREIQITICLLQNTLTRMSDHVTLAVATTTQKATFTVHEISVNVNTLITGFQRLAEAGLTRSEHDVAQHTTPTNS